MPPTLLILLLLLLCILHSSSPSAAPPTFSENWAVLVSTSRYWFNYRHSVNTLAIYEIVKRLGIPDSNILLMLADYPANDPRNRFPGRMYLSNDHSAQSVARDDVEVDFRGPDVNSENFLRVLTGRNHHEFGVPPNQKLMSTNTSRVLLYMTGHGGDEFLKFHDVDELTSDSLGAAFSEMHIKGMYGELLFVLDTCQAERMANHIHIDVPDPEIAYEEDWGDESGPYIETRGKYVSPSILFMASSRLGENSYALHGDTTIGVSTVDRFTASLINFLVSHVTALSENDVERWERQGQRGTAKKKRDSWRNNGWKKRSKSRYSASSPPSLQDLFDSFQPSFLYSNPVLVKRGYPRDLSSIPVAYFFAGSPFQQMLQNSSLSQSMSLNDAQDKRVAIGKDGEEGKCIYQKVIEQDEERKFGTVCTADDEDDCNTAEQEHKSEEGMKAEDCPLDLSWYDEEFEWLEKKKKEEEEEEEEEIEYRKFRKSYRPVVDGLSPFSYAMAFSLSVFVVAFGAIAIFSVGI